MDKETVTKLAREAAEHEMVLNALGMRNTVGLTVDERVALDADYMVAKDRYAYARERYSAALREMIETEKAG